MQHKIKDIEAKGALRSEGPLPAKLLEEAFAGLDVDLPHTSGHYSFELSANGDEIVARGTLKATLGLGCARCLGPAKVDVDLPLTMLYVPSGGEDELGDEDLDDVDAMEHDGLTVDLAPMLREQLILAIPMTVYCKDDCRGLCAVCGQDKNQSDCGHGEAPAPSPLASQLAELQKKQPH